MDRRRMIAGAAGLAGAAVAVAVPGGLRSATPVAQAPAGVVRVDAFGAKLKVGEEVELREGVTVRFVGVLRDSRCPADVQCVDAGSAEVSLAFTLADASQNERTFDRVVAFPPGGKALAYDTASFAIVAHLSGDSGVPTEELVLSLYLVVTED